jgi:hypothetical protein
MRLLTRWTGHQVALREKAGDEHDESDEGQWERHWDQNNGPHQAAAAAEKSQAADAEAVRARSEILGWLAHGCHQQSVNPRSMNG